MKVLVLSSSFPRYEGDFIGNFVYELAQGLNNEGFETIILTAHTPRSKFKEIFNGLEVNRFHYFLPLKYQRLSPVGGMTSNFKQSNLAKLQVPLFFLSELFSTIKLIRQRKIDVINTHWLIPQGFVGAICRKYFGTLHIATVHAADVFGLDHFPLKRKIANFIVNNCDEIIVVSSFIEKKLLSLVSPQFIDKTKEKITILPMGVYTQKFQQSIDTNKLITDSTLKSKFNLLFIGRLSEKKGISYLIKAMTNIVSQIQEVTLIVCGEGNLKDELENLTKSSNLEQNIKFTGFVTEEEKLKYLHLSDILIVPSIVLKSGETEGLPVIVLEGIAAGKPIIASDVSGIKDVIIDGWNGYLVEQKNSDQIALKVLQLLKNVQLRTNFSENALETSKKYDWSEIIKIYKNMILNHAKLTYKGSTL